MPPARRNLFPTFLCLLIILGGQAASGEGSPGADVLVGVFARGPDIEGYRSVMASAVSYKLSSLGLETSSLPAEAGDKELEARARKDGVPATLACRYAIAGGRMSVSLSWHAVPDAGSPVERSESGSLDLQADAIIFRALDSLLLAVKPDIDRLASARAASRVAAASQTPAASQTAAGSTTIVAPPPKPSAEAPQSTATPAGPSRKSGLVITAGFAPFLAIGPASSYFTIGLVPSVLASFHFPTQGGGFSVGLYGGVNIFSATGLIDTASSYLIPVGPDLRYEAGTGKPVLVFAHVCGGPALLLMNTGAQGSLFDITEFLKSGLGATLMLTPRVGLSVAADYEIYFEMPYLIMGFSPTAMLSVAL